MSKGKKLKIIITSVVIALTLAFIWGNSAVSVAQSGQSSGGVYGSVKPALDKIFGEGVITHHVFRKTAHLVEFFCLGIEVCLLYYFIYGIKPSKLSEIFLCGLAVAVIDESIQILSSRGSDVFDVLIDFIGFAIAVGLSNLAFIAIKKIKEKGQTGKKAVVIEPSVAVTKDQSEDTKTPSNDA